MPTRQQIDAFIRDLGADPQYTRSVLIFPNEVRIEVAVPGDGTFVNGVAQYETTPYPIEEPTNEPA